MVFWVEASSNFKTEDQFIDWARINLYPVLDYEQKKYALELCQKHHDGMYPHPFHQSQIIANIPIWWILWITMEIISHGERKWHNQLETRDIWQSYFQHTDYVYKVYIHIILKCSYMYVHISISQSASLFFSSSLQRTHLQLWGWRLNWSASPCVRFYTTIYMAQIVFSFCT